MNRRLTRGLFLVLAMGASGVVAASVSCTDTTGMGLKPDGGMGGGGGSATASSTSASGINTDGMACEDVCKNDLKKIVTCYGETVSECTPEQGCYDAKCIDNPCEAARLAKSSYGCDYWALKTGLRDQTQGACFAAFVANTWSTPVKINVDYKGKQSTEAELATFVKIPKGQGEMLTFDAYDPTMGLGVGEVAILFLARNEMGNVEPCPDDTKMISTEAGVSGTGIGDAFHIWTDKPVVAYQIVPYGGGKSAFASATLLLPSSSWDTNYIAVNAYKQGTIDPSGQPFIDVLAQEDGTEVTILPTANIVGGNGVAAANAGESTKYTLNKGQFLQIYQPEELSGSPIQSNKPVGVWGGSSCLYIPLDKNGCDSAHQQIPPVKALGSEYAAVRYRGRNGNPDEVVPWRIVGAVNGTELTWIPEPPPGAPTKLELGTVLEFESPGGFVVKSQGPGFPFYLSAYMTGSESFLGEGDPDWVNVIPPAQFLDNYVLFTDPTYPETNLVVIRTKSKTGDKAFADVFLSCLDGGKTPLEGWQDLGDYQYTRVDLVTGDFMGVNGCANGRHEMSSSLPFGVTVWGWGSMAAEKTSLVSYAYPAGASVQPINNVVVPADPK